MSDCDAESQEHFDITSRDYSSFAKWMARTEEPIRSSLRRFASCVDVESVVQETFLRVWTSARLVDGDGKPNLLLRYGLRIARNLAVSEARRRRMLDLDAAQAPEPTVEPSSVPDPSVADAVHACREKLPQQPRAAIDARIQSEGLVRDEELAARVGMRTNTFLQNVTRARKLLAECLRLRGIDLALEMR
jgi:RNA polymerase sigma factor (sigma-70 family)